MPINEPSSNIPLAAVFRAANGLVAARLIEDWALGGALAAIYYVEPFTTYDADIFFIPVDKGLAAGIPALYGHLQSQGWQVEREHLMVRGFPVQFLAADVGVSEAEALKQGMEAKPKELVERARKFTRRHKPRSAALGLLARQEAMPLDQLLLA